MKKTTITVKLKRVKRRHREFYDVDSPFSYSRIERSRVQYKRHARTKKEVDKDWGL